MKKLFFAVAFVFASLAVMAQSKISPMTLNYLIERTEQKSEQERNPNFIRFVRNGSVEYIPAFIHFYDNVDVDLLSDYGVHVNSVYECISVVSADIPADQVEALAKDASVRYVEMMTPAEIKMDNARKDAFVDQVHEGTSPLTMPYTGKGVIVGISDHDFQYTHPAFYNDDYTKSRILCVWEQETYGGTRPSGFQYGAEYADAENIAYRKYDTRTPDAGGHGSHVAGIAAGGRYRNTGFHGVAPESDIILVSYDFASTRNNAADAADYVFKKAAALGKPAVVNFSIGSHYGPHDGTSTTDRLFEALTGEGKIIVGAAGNEGNTEFHATKTFSNADTSFTTMIKYTPPVRYSMLEIWADPTCDASFRFVIYNGTDKVFIDSTRTYSISDLRTGSIIQKSFDIASRNDGNKDIKVNINGSSELNPINNKTHLSFYINCSAMRYNFFLGIQMVGTEGSVHAWTDDRYSSFTDGRNKNFVAGDNRATVGEIGGTSKGIITVGAYYTRPMFSSFAKHGDITSFSSRGPLCDGRIKPEIVAPGSYLVSAIPNLDGVVNSPDYSGALIYDKDGEKIYYGYMQGTSMAAPFVTGVIATWLQANPKLTKDDILDVFEHTAIRDDRTSFDIPNGDAGWGKINAYAGLLYILGNTTAVENSDMPGSMMAYPNPTSGEFNIGFIKEDDNVVVSVYGINGQLVLSEQVGTVNPGDDRNFDLSGVANGAYVVRVGGDRHNESFRLLVRK